MTIKAILFNKATLLSLGVLVFATALTIGATTAFFSSEASANDNSFTTGTMDLLLTQSEGGPSPSATQSATWNFNDMAPGDTPSEQSLWLRNAGSVTGESLSIAIPGGWNNPSNIAEQMRITTLSLDGDNLLEGGAGATMREYTEPVNCTATASTGNLASTVSNASAGDVICVEGGNYTPGSFTIASDNVTLVALEGPNSSNSATIDGEINVDGDGVAIKGLIITNPNGGYGIVAHDVDDLSVTDNHIQNIGSSMGSGSVQGVYIKAANGPVDGFEIAYNRIENMGNAGLNDSVKGIFVGDSSPSHGINDVHIHNNIIDTVVTSDATFGAGGRGAYGVLVNHGADTTNLVVENNSFDTFSGWWTHVVGLEGSTSGAIVTSNTFDNVTAGGADNSAVFFESNTGAGSVTINQNDFDSNAGGVALHPTNQAGTYTIDATNNWWGDFDPSDQIFENNSTIDTSNFAGGPFAGYVNGNDYNGNGFADLDDLRNDPLHNNDITLEPYTGTEDKEFVMAVQLDGPTTGNSFQGLTLDDMTIEFTLNQI